MNKIPTAEEFCKNYTRLRSAMAIQDLTECMNEYAKLHVKAALEAARVQTNLKWCAGESGVLTREDVELIYPENLIV